EGRRQSLQRRAQELAGQTVRSLARRALNFGGPAWRISRSTGREPAAICSAAGPLTAVPDLTSDLTTGAMPGLASDFASGLASDLASLAALRDANSAGRGRGNGGPDTNGCMAGRMAAVGAGGVGGTDGAVVSSSGVISG